MPTILKWQNADLWLSGDGGGRAREGEEKGIPMGMRKDCGGDCTAIYRLKFAKLYIYI